MRGLSSPVAVSRKEPGPLVLLRGPALSSRPAAWPCLQRAVHSGLRPARTPRPGFLESFCLHKLNTGLLALLPCPASPCRVCPTLAQARGQAALPGLRPRPPPLKPGKSCHVPSRIPQVPASLPPSCRPRPPGHHCSSLGTAAIPSYHLLDHCIPSVPLLAAARSPSEPALPHGIAKPMPRPSLACRARPTCPRHPLLSP